LLGLHVGEDGCATADFFPLRRYLGFDQAASPTAERSAMPMGTVKWFNAKQGFGLIRPQDALSVATPDVFVHISAVERAGLTTLAEGQLVEYEIIENSGRLSADLKVPKKTTDEAPKA
jgi:CspA family cold shock protein